MNQSAQPLCYKLSPLTKWTIDFNTNHNIGGLYIYQFNDNTMFHFAKGLGVL
jgi:hypothetical protein